METSLTTIRSQFFCLNLEKAFLFKFSVSAAKPITKLGLCLLFLPRNSTISLFLSNSIDFIHEFFKFEKKLPKGLSKKLFLYFNENSEFKKYISILADRGF